MSSGVISLEFSVNPVFKQNRAFEKIGNENLCNY